MHLHRARSRDTAGAGEERPNQWQDAQVGGSEFGSRRFFEDDREGDVDDDEDA